MKRDYQEKHCWQYDIRLKNREADLRADGFTEDYVKGLKVSDFTFEEVKGAHERERLKRFIKRHEWLGNIGQLTTHWFACYHEVTGGRNADLFGSYKALAGVILFSMPPSFSKLLGDGTRKTERLISRGACISWSPKNLASAFLMWAIKQMVLNTRYRLFTCYADPHAKEVGTIYQACNFYYLGQQSGTIKRYINPYTGKVVSDRFFRARSAYKKYAKDLGIEWQRNWNDDQVILWENIPEDVAKKLKDMSRKRQAEAQKMDFAPKHKYAYVLGRDRKETKNLRDMFENLNKVYPYPRRESVTDEVPKEASHS